VGAEKHQANRKHIYGASQTCVLTEQMETTQRVSSFSLSFNKKNYIS